MKLSIITINRNNDSGLRQTMQSVLSQTCTDFEYVIVDGASTDKSVEVIHSFAPQPDMNINGLQVRWLSEPDTGIYNAMNKGVHMSKGEYLLFLNSGDWLYRNDVVRNILSIFDGTDIIQGNIVVVKDDVEIIQRGYGRSELSMVDVYNNQFLHQATFTRRACFEQYGYFDETYRINGDTVFYAKCLGFGNASFKYVDLNIAFFDTNGISADPQRKWVKIREQEDCRYEEMFPERMRKWLRNSNNKTNFYDTLHKHKWIWHLSLMLVKLSNLIDK